METRSLGRSGLQVSALGLGTMMFGDQIGEADAFAQMDYALEAGITLFDTAELYTVPPKPETFGESERIIGRWMKDRGARDKIVLASKVVGRSSRLTWLRSDGHAPRLTRADIHEAVEGSLSRLGVEAIDLYQLHWPDRQSQLFGETLHGYRHYSDEFAAFDDTLEILEGLIQTGKIRHVGLSNETPWGVMRFLGEADSRKLPRMASIQNAYSLVNRAFENGLAEIALSEGIGLLAYSPLGQGALFGKYLDGARPEGSRGALFGRMGRYETPSAENAIRGYLSVARDFGVEPAHLFLQFVTTRSWVTSNLFGASTLEQLKTNIASLSLKWTEEMETAVNAVHARFSNPCP